ncbi:MAG: DUF5331 domain-containing protein [Kovacikia sp.]
MNTQQIRQSVRDKWLSYYEENRQWLSRLGVWVNCDGQRRPSSGFILATLSVLEPQLAHLLPLIVDLSSNPDRIILALGLNFNPDEELEALKVRQETSPNSENPGEISEAKIRMLPAASDEFSLPSPQETAKVRARMDESCRGSRDHRE